MLPMVLREMTDQAGRYLVLASLPDASMLAFGTRARDSEPYGVYEFSAVDGKTERVADSFT
jgi:hypothetical protein